MASERRDGGIERWKERGRGDCTSDKPGGASRSGGLKYTALAVLFHLVFVLHTNRCCATLPNLPSFSIGCSFACLKENQMGAKLHLLASL